MKIYVTLKDLGVILDVYYAVLKDGTVAVKCSLDSDFVMFMTKSQFKQLIEMAREKEIFFFKKTIACIYLTFFC